MPSWMPMPTASSFTDFFAIHTPKVAGSASFHQRISGYLGVIWGWGIALISLMPGKKMPVVDWPLGIPLDKWAHFAVYGVWMWLLFPMAILKEFSRLKIALSAALFGLLMEVLQAAFTRDRIFEISDIAANSAGILAGWWSYRFTHKRG